MSGPHSSDQIGWSRTKFFGRCVLALEGCAELFERVVQLRENRRNTSPGDASAHLKDRAGPAASIRADPHLGRARRVGSPEMVWVR